MSEKAMMPKRSKREIHWNVLVIPCARHGDHKVIVAGLDSIADDTAEMALRGWEQDYPDARRINKVMAVSEAEIILGMSVGGDDDDEELPF